MKLCALIHLFNHELSTWTWWNDLVLAKVSKTTINSPGRNHWTSQFSYWIKVARFSQQTRPTATQNHSWLSTWTGSPWQHCWSCACAMRGKTEELNSPEHRAVDSGSWSVFNGESCGPARRRYCCYNVRAGGEDLAGKVLKVHICTTEGTEWLEEVTEGHHYRETQGEMLKACKLGLPSVSWHC